MNTVPRHPLPAADYFVTLRYPALLGGETERRGPYASYRAARAAIAAARAPYPGDYQPSVTLERIEHPTTTRGTR